MVTVVDPSPLNWLTITFNTMLEPVRASPDGGVVPSLAKAIRWLTDRTLEIELRSGVLFHDRTPLTAQNIAVNFEQMQRWAAPHPPGTWLNLPVGTTCEVVDGLTVRFHFPAPDGLAPVKMRGFHIGSPRFWQRLGFGYARFGTGEGRW